MQWDGTVSWTAYFPGQFGKEQFKALTDAKGGGQGPYPQMAKFWLIFLKNPIFKISPELPPPPLTKRCSCVRPLDRSGYNCMDAKTMCHVDLYCAVLTHGSAISLITATCTDDAQRQGQHTQCNKVNVMLRTAGKSTFGFLRL